MSGHGAGECRKAACGNGGMDGYKKAWTLDKETEICCWAVGCRAEKGMVRGLLQAVHIAPLFTLTQGLQEAQGGHMPNSPGGQSCPALSLTSLPAPLSPVRYMSVWSQSCMSSNDIHVLFTHYISVLDGCLSSEITRKLEIHTQYTVTF